MVDYARKKGAAEASAIVSVENVASQRMLEKNGFTVISRWVYYSTNGKFQRQKTDSRIAVLDDLAQVWQYLQQSHTYSMSAGRYVNRWHWYRLDREALRGLIKEKRIIVTGSPVDGVMVINPKGYWDKTDVLQIVYLDSKSKRSLQSMFSFAANLCMESGFERLHLLCQQDISVKSMVEKFKIEESEEFLLYNKILTS
jgi:hypothetical protein